MKIWMSPFTAYFCNRWSSGRKKWVIFTRFTACSERKKLKREMHIGRVICAKYLFFLLSYAVFLAPWNRDGIHPFYKQLVNKPHFYWPFGQLRAITKKQNWVFLNIWGCFFFFFSFMKICIVASTLESWLELRWNFFPPKI